MFSSKCESFALNVTYAWVAKVVSKLGAQVHVKLTESFCDLNWQLWHHKHWKLMSLSF